MHVRTCIKNSPGEFFVLSLIDIHKTFVWLKTMKHRREISVRQTEIFDFLPLFIRGKLGTSKIDLGDKMLEEAMFDYILKR